MDFGYLDHIFLFYFDFICSVFFSRPVVGMLFGAVLWYCSLVPFQTFSQQEAYEALSRYKNLFFIILINTNINIINSAIIIIAITNITIIMVINMIIIMKSLPLQSSSSSSSLYLIYQLLHKVQIKAFLSSLMGEQYVCFSFSC